MPFHGWRSALVPPDCSGCERRRIPGHANLPSSSALSWGDGQGISESRCGIDVSHLSLSRTVYLISCASKKRRTSAPARDLYISDWFLKARAYVEGAGSPWFILSAEHGLVPPDRILRPYERTLNAMSTPERREWATRVTTQMDSSLPATDRIVVLAGLRYREFLMDYLRQRAAVDVPMEGLSIGRQLRYLAQALHHERM
jgi:hypothetical protein